MMRRLVALVEWPTVLLLVATYGVFAFATTGLYALSALLGIVMAGIAIAQFSSLQHEVLHGHPFANRLLNEALVFPGLTLTIPYGRFRDTHLAHHHDPDLTDPYDDPETNYLDPAVWARMGRLRQAVLRINNTLLGRIVIGPIVSNLHWLLLDARLIAAGNGRVARDWALHGAGVALVAAWLWTAAMPWWAFLLAVWLGQSLLKIRTYLEHRAHESARARTVVIEDRGPLALLFLNNNYHSVHHMHPHVAWYRLPQLYAGNRAHYLRRNEGYVYRSYGAILREYLFRAKDPVPHPLWPLTEVTPDAAAAPVSVAARG